MSCGGQQCAISCLLSFLNPFSGNTPSRKMQAREQENGYLLGALATMNTSSTGYHFPQPRMSAKSCPFLRRMPTIWPIGQNTLVLPLNAWHQIAALMVRISVDICMGPYSFFSHSSSASFGGVSTNSWG